MELRNIPGALQHKFTNQMRGEMNRQSINKQFHDRIADFELFQIVAKTSVVTFLSFAPSQHHSSNISTPCEDTMKTALKTSSSSRQIFSLDVGNKLKESHHIHTHSFCLSLLRDMRNGFYLIVPF